MRGKENPICVLCPKTLCTQFPNGQWVKKDYAEDVVTYEQGSFYNCEKRAEYGKDGMFSGDDGTVYILFQSVDDVRDEINRLKGETNEGEVNSPNQPAT